jgi:hypothetical protein
MQTWFYEDNKKVEIGNQKYWIYYKKRNRNGKIRNKKAEFRFKADENQVCECHGLAEKQKKNTNVKLCFDNTRVQTHDIPHSRPVS